MIKKAMQEERDAPLRRISATTGTTEQLQSGTGTPTAELMVTERRLSSLSHFRIASLEMKTWISPESSRPRISIGPSNRNDIQIKSKYAVSRFTKSITTQSSFPMVKGRENLVLNNRTGRFTSMLQEDA